MRLSNSLSRGRATRSSAFCLASPTHRRQPAVNAISRCRLRSMVAHANPSKSRARHGTRFAKRGSVPTLSLRAWILPLSSLTSQGRPHAFQSSFFDRYRSATRRPAHALRVLSTTSVTPPMSAADPSVHVLRRHLGTQGTGANLNNFFITIMNEALHGSDAAPYNGLSITSLGL